MIRRLDDEEVRRYKYGVHLSGTTTTVMQVVKVPSAFKSCLAPEGLGPVIPG
jgi:hypothetical protein